MLHLFNARRLVTLLAAAGAVVAFAAPSSARTDAAEPTTAEMTLAVSDLPGAKVAKQRYIKAAAPATSTYSREFRPGVRIGSTFLVLLDTEVSLYPTPALAAKDLQEVRTLLSTKQGRALFGEALAAGFRQTSKLKLKLKRVAVTQPVSLGAGQLSLHVAATFVLVNKKMHTMHLAFVQTDRALASFFAMPLNRLPKADLRKLAQLQSARFQRSFTIASVAVPTVTGTATPAQTLTATPGDWSGAPSSFTYQWSRCDSTATTCADIPGATAATYVVAAEDAGSVLRATVVAGNSVSSAAATSAVTAPVA